MGRSKRTTKLESEICRRLCNGETLRSICRDESMPHWDTVYDWIGKDPDFARRIARAREIGHDALAEECLQISDNVEYGATVTEKAGSGVGKKGKTSAKEIKKGDMTDHRKLKIWTRLQLLAKWNPKKYGERTQVDMNVKSDLAERLAAGRRRVGK